MYIASGIDGGVILTIYPWHIPWHIVNIFPNERFHIRPLMYRYRSGTGSEHFDELEEEEELEEDELELDIDETLSSSSESESELSTSPVMAWRSKSFWAIVSQSEKISTTDSRLAVTA